MELVVHVILSILVIFNSVQGLHRHTNGHQSILQYNDEQGPMTSSRTRKHIFSYRNPNALIQSKSFNSGLKTGIQHKFSYAKANREFPLPAARSFIQQKMKIIEAPPISNVLKPNMKIAESLPFSDLVKLNTNIAKSVPASGLSTDPFDSLMRKNKNLVGSIEQLIVDALFDGPPAGNMNNGQFVGIASNGQSVDITNKGPSLDITNNGPSIVKANNGPIVGKINDTPYVVQQENKAVKNWKTTNIVKVKTVNKEAVINKLGKTTINRDTMAKNEKITGKSVKDVVKSDLGTTKKINKQIEKNISKSKIASQSVGQTSEKGKESSKTGLKTGKVEGRSKAGPKTEKAEVSPKAEPVEPTEAVRTEAPTTPEPVEPSGNELYSADEYCACMTWCPPGTEYRGRCGLQWSYGLSTCCIPSYYGDDDDGDYD
ncbi:uncharacterized protein LOC134692874 [Mytilus trossulus]|uniref:uncharacterized protein LOC134692874 n=1 Tax=Mytilus trossulus TaxID=6551 RepID=UPI003006BC41